MMVFNIYIWFKKLEILPILSLYFYSLMLFLVDNWHYFQTNSSVHDSNTRYDHHLYIPSVTPAAIQRVTACCIKIFNKLPPAISVFKNNKTTFFTLYSSMQSIQSQIWHRTHQAQSTFSMLHKYIHSQYT